MKLYTLYEKVKIGDFSPQAKQYVKDFMIAKDLLINSWELYDDNEMLKLLIKGTDFDRKNLKRFVQDWYNDDRRRNKIIISVKPGDPDFEKWFNEYIDVNK